MSAGRYGLAGAGPRWGWESDRASESVSARSDTVSVCHAFLNVRRRQRGSLFRASRREARRFAQVLARGAPRGPYAALSFGPAWCSL